MTGLFSRQAAQEAKDEAIQRVDEHALPEWKLTALRAIRTVARARPEFTSDAIWALLAAWNTPEPHERRAFGPVMKRATALGYCEPTRKVRQSVRVACHSRPLAVYRSLIYATRAA